MRVENTTHESPLARASFSVISTLQWLAFVRRSSQQRTSKLLKHSCQVFASSQHRQPPPKSSAQATGKSMRAPSLKQLRAAYARSMSATLRRIKTKPNKNKIHGAGNTIQTLFCQSPLRRPPPSSCLAGPIRKAMIDNPLEILSVNARIYAAKRCLVYPFRRKDRSFA